MLEVTYARSGHKVTSVKLVNVPSFLFARGVRVEDPELGPLLVDVAYGGNFYAIVEPQGGYLGVDALGAKGILSISPRVRAAVDQAIEAVHPLDASIRGVGHVLWADPLEPGSTAGRSAVFYGEKAIDRSPCGTGTSARLAQLAATGRLAEGEAFEHQSYIRSRFTARIEGRTTVGPFEAIRPSIEGSAFVTGYNQIWIDDEEPFPEGFILT